jgi:hypothetical protein
MFLHRLFPYYRLDARGLYGVPENEGARSREPEKRETESRKSESGKSESREIFVEKIRSNNYSENSEWEEKMEKKRHHFTKLLCWQRGVEL